MRYATRTHDAVAFKHPVTQPPAVGCAMRKHFNTKSLENKNDSFKVDIRR
jgi:hypothetical protein